MSTAAANGAHENGHGETSSSSSNIFSLETATSPRAPHNSHSTSSDMAATNGLGNGKLAVANGRVTNVPVMKESRPAPGLITGQLSPIASRKPVSTRGTTRAAAMAKIAADGSENRDEEVLSPRKSRSYTQLQKKSMAPELCATYANAIRSSMTRERKGKLADDDDEVEAELADYYAEISKKQAASRQLRFSEKSMRLMEDTDRLLNSIPSYGGHPPLGSRAVDKSRSLSPDGFDDDDRVGGSYGRRGRGGGEGAEDPVPHATASRFLLHTPRFPRIDFDDWLSEDAEAQKPAWKQLQDSVRSTFRKPMRTAERNRELNECHEAVLNRRKTRVRSESPFSMCPDGESFIPRAPSWFASGAMQPRGLKEAFKSTPGSGLYAAPAVSYTQGVEGSSQSPAAARYEKLVDDIEARLLKVSILPEHMKGATRRDFHNAPQPSVGSMAEQLVDKGEMVLSSLPRPFYSRPTRTDPDYFDFDLQHSVDMFKRPEGVYQPRGPQVWESRLLSEARVKGDAPISGHMFTPGHQPSDYRNTTSSYLSAALRTPSFWEHRFHAIGAQVRESNPVSMASLELNRPIPNRFTAYVDPDFADYEDPKELAENL